MKAKELTDKTDTELADLKKQLVSELFQAKLGNHTNQLDDTATLPKKRKDIARVQGELRRREISQIEKSLEQALAGESK